MSDAPFATHEAGGLHAFQLPLEVVAAAAEAGAGSAEAGATGWYVLLPALAAVVGTSK